MTKVSAFPWAIDDGENITGQKGMTLRDYFAAKAIQGLLADGVGSLMDEELADWAYKLANAMMKAREQ